jgi:selenocysteine-specific elongation factor
MLLDSGELAKVTDEFYFSRTALDELTRKLGKFARGSEGRLIDVAGFKDLAGVSRKYAIPLLEYFDREKVTARSCDKRIIL